jgi:F-type H+-transporting ATPase subunit b
MGRHHSLTSFLGAVIVFVVAIGPLARAQAQEGGHDAHAEPAKTGGAAAEAHGGAHAEEGHAETEKVPGPLDIQPTLSIFTLIVFVGLMLILGKFAWKPLLEALHKREAHLEHVLHETERARNESETMLAEHRKLLSRAGDEVRGILDKARTEAQTLADSIAKQAQTEADQTRQRAQRDIAAARDQALAEIWQKTADMAVSVAGKVMERELGAEDHRRLLDAAIKELPAGAANGHGGHA